MWNAIVIGSGIGGLSAAGLLAGVDNRRVLVLEKHMAPGGLMQAFRRDGACWDVGLHYVGQMEEGSLARRLFDFLSGGELRWQRMPDEFERFVYSGLDFRVPSDPQQFERRLIERFPQEKAAIRQYFRDVRRVQRWCTLGFTRAFMPRPAGSVIGLAQRPGRRRALQTTGDYLQRHFRSPMLRALLASQWPDYGLPPAKSAFAIHAQIVAHYLHGAWFPEGGSNRIVRTLEKGIERHGGEVRVCQEVNSIITRGGRAVGVRVVDRSGSAPREVEHEAATVISDVGAPLTFQRLLPTEGEVGRRTRAMRALIDRLQDGVSAVCLYLRLRAPVSSLGIRGENVWVNATLDHDALSEQGESLLDGYPCHIYVSFPSAKAGVRHVHTAEILSLVDCRAFQRWAQRRPGNRGPAYALLKQRISEGLLRLAETAIPGLRALVEYAELATPLTVEHFTSHPAGRFYGLAATPARYASPLPGPHTPIQNLLLSGTDAGCLGVVGALMGGVAAASQALGPKGFPRIRAAIGRPRQFAGIHPLPARKQRAEIRRKRRLTPSIWKIELALERAVDFVPGQFARVQVADCEWRDYSIAGLADVRLTFLIDTRTAGLGSQFALAAQPGTRAPVELPLGSFGLRPTPRRKVFVATGTGLAPFLPMLRQLQRDGGIGNAQLLFGYGHASDDITAELDGVAVDLVRCVTRAAPPPGGFSGRVSQALASLAFDPAATDFYLCGSAAMVADCRAVLERRNACRVMAEAF